MKKTLLFICLAFCFVVLFTGCLGLESSDGSFSPPRWIRGTWQDTSQSNIFIFTAHTVTQRTIYTSANISSMYADDNVVEVITDSLYQFAINPDSVSTVSYRYELLTATTLNFTRITPTETTEPVELEKQ